jgi:hypothetical protein
LISRLKHQKVKRRTGCKMSQGKYRKNKQPVE